MKKERIYLLLFAFYCSLGAAAQDFKAAFEDVKQQFELRLKTTSDALKDYLVEYPYTIYEDEVYTMQGILYTEKSKYKNAIKAFSKVSVKNLPRHWEAMYYFYSGYAYLQTEDYAATLSQMLHIKDKSNVYSERARYYAGYCYYMQEEYDRALTEFIKLEKKGDYKHIVPYYIVQIYYAQGQYEKMSDKAERLLAEYPDSEFNAEMHRILGEMYYQTNNYYKAEGHLKSYCTALDEAGAELLRNDLYLLGVSQYMIREYASAVGSLKRVSLLEDTISENVCLHLGHSYLRLDDLENAKLSYAAAIRYNINATVREEAMYNYVQVTYLQNSAMGESITAFQDFLREYPNSKYISKVYALMADLYMSSKNYLEALNALLTIPVGDQRIEDTKQYLRYQLAVDAFIQGKMDEVLGWAQEVISNSSKPSNYKTEAYYLAAQARYAIQDYQQCVENIDIYFQQANVNSSSNIAMAIYLK